MNDVLGAYDRTRLAVLPQFLSSFASRRMIRGMSARDWFTLLKTPGGLRAAKDEAEGVESKTSLRTFDEEDGGLGIYFTGVIGLDIIGDDVLEVLGDGQAKERNVNVYINSPGGNVFDGIDIGTKLARHAKGYTAVVDGLAGSAATIAALRGRRLLFEPGTEWLVHEAAFESLCFSGRVSDMEAIAKSLRSTNDEMAELYAAATGKEPVEMLSLMAEDRIMSCREACEYGFGEMRNDAIDKQSNALSNGAEGGEASRFSSAMSEDRIRTFAKFLDVEHDVMELVK